MSCRPRIFPRFLSNLCFLSTKTVHKQRLPNTPYLNMGRKNRSTLVELDGRTLEGGGQLLRNSLCLSALTGTPVQIHHIRGNRSSGGGLKAQHLACVNWLAHACNAKVKGAEKGSTTLTFEPDDSDKPHSDVSPAFKKTTSNGEIVYLARLDIGTAGATGLALQAILPYILFSRFPSDHPTRLTLTGGTNVSGSPSYEYITQILLPTLHSIGFPEIKPQLKRRGWSQGGSSIGEISFDIPARPSPVLSAFTRRPENTRAKRSPRTHLQVTFIAPASVHDHFRTVLPPVVKYHFGDEFIVDNGNLNIKREGSLHERRFYIIIVATMSESASASSDTYKLARDWLYDRKIRSLERTTTEMAEAVTNSLATEVESGAYVDEHLRDQLIIFQALAKGTSEIYPGVDEDGELREPSLHTRTAEWVAKQMLGVKFNAESACEGLAYGAEMPDAGSSITQGQGSKAVKDEDALKDRLQDLSVEE